MTQFVLLLLSDDFGINFYKGQKKITQPLHKKNLKIKITQILQNFISPSIRIGQEIQCLLYVGFFKLHWVNLRNLNIL